MKEPRRAERSDCLGCRSDRQPLFHGWYDRLRLWLDHQERWGPVVVEVWSDHSSHRSHHQPLSSTVRLPGTTVGPPTLGQNGNLGASRGIGSGVSMGAALQESSYRKMSKSLVRWGETAKEKSVS
jgi:hypothetical protein